MDKKERVALIRKGNESFNNGNIQKAIEIFVKTNYKDGLARIADFYYYDEKMPLIAFKFYKMADMKDKVDEIFDRMIFALGEWIGEDKLKNGNIPPQKDYTPFKVSPKLKILAEEILMDNEDEEG